MHKVRIMGCRGIPANHGGFETFAEHFSLYLRDRGWDVEVYCQVNGKGALYTDKWCGIQRINIPVNGDSAFATAIFDLKGILHSLHSKDPVLTLGYNTAIFNVMHRLCRVPNIFNMDGIEWKRGKWSFPFKVWFYLNEVLACWIGNKLVADHPEIQKHLSRLASTNKISVIPYAAKKITQADESAISALGLKQGNYCILIARPEPENSILEVVEAFSRYRRDFKMVVLGDYSLEKPYQAMVLRAASKEVIFPGAIYDERLVQALRYFSRFYIHGHTVGGTNPSLVEAMGAGSAVLAQDNIFNRWVTGNRAIFFSTIDDCEKSIDRMIKDDQLINAVRYDMSERHAACFTFDRIHANYEALIRSLG